MPLLSQFLPATGTSLGRINQRFPNAASEVSILGPQPASASKFRRLLIVHFLKGTLAGIPSLPARIVRKRFEHRSMKLVGVMVDLAVIVILGVQVLEGR
jgi:hypothetical protein